MKKFWDWIDDRAIVHRLLLVFTLYLTFHCYKWAILFAIYSQLTGTETAAIILAVSGPVTTLQGYVFSTYANYRKASKELNNVGTK